MQPPRWPLGMCTQLTFTLLPSTFSRTDGTAAGTEQIPTVEIQPLWLLPERCSAQILPDSEVARPVNPVPLTALSL